MRKAETIYKLYLKLSVNVYIMRKDELKMDQARKRTGKFWKVGELDFLMVP